MWMVRVPFEAGYDQPHHRDSELRPGQIDGEHAPNPDGDEPA
jgi:hypothetical protein